MACEISPWGRTRGFMAGEVSPWGYMHGFMAGEVSPWGCTRGFMAGEASPATKNDFHPFVLHNEQAFKVNRVCFVLIYRILFLLRRTFVTASLSFV
jgi:hypothetical protein